MNIEKTRTIALGILQTFPKSKNGQPYLVLKNKKKIFFTRFIKKYGLEAPTTRYNEADLKRRLRCIEFFPYFVSSFDLKPARKKNRLQLDSHFHRMVIVELNIRNSKKLELISFYPL